MENPEFWIKEMIRETSIGSRELEKENYLPTIPKYVAKSKTAVLISFRLGQSN